MNEIADAALDWRLHNYAFGKPGASGRIRTCNEDFAVDELPLVEPDGEGEHLWVRVRKNGANTQWVAARLADALGVAHREVSFAGRKDRHAVCTQWFSARVVGPERSGWAGRLPAGIEVLETGRHRRKLKRGALRGNRFTIVIRDLAGETDTLPGRLAHLRAEGVPNFFGEQRFGHAGANLERAAEMFSSRRRRVPRARRELYLSAARAQIFNAVLAHRVADASWNQLQPGDVAALDGSRSVFAVDELDESLRARNAALDVHPSGPLWGRGEPATKLEVRELEQRIAGRHQVLADGLAASGLQQARRPLRVRVNGLEAERGPRTLTLRFDLPPGSFATAVLRELVNYVSGPPAAAAGST